jgi:hypothetical protein
MIELREKISDMASKAALSSKTVNLYSPRISTTVRKLSEPVKLKSPKISNTSKSVKYGSKIQGNIINSPKLIKGKHSKITGVTKSPESKLIRKDTLVGNSYKGMPKGKVPMSPVVKSPRPYQLILPPKPPPPTSPGMSPPPTSPYPSIPPTSPPPGKNKKHLVTPTGKSQNKEWTPEDIKSAIAWKDGFSVHAIRSPYRRGIDEKSYNVDHLPEGLKVMPSYTGKGSQQASARVTGAFPKRLTVDVGNQDLIISRQGGNHVSMRHVRDTRGTISQNTVKKIGHSISQKRGKLYHSNTGGGLVISRRQIRGY